MENIILEAMRTRRSAREYLPEMPKKEDLEKIVQTGLYAASGKNMQSAIVFAITGKALRERLMEMTRIVFG